MRSGWDYDERVAVDDPADDPEEHLDGRPEHGSFEAMRQLTLTVLEDDNPALSLDCVASMLGILRMHGSEADIARRHRVTRAAVSKRCLLLSERLGIPNKFGRTEVTRQRCRRARIKATT